MEENREPSNKLMPMWSHKSKKPRIYDEERTVSSDNGIGVGKTRQPHTKERDLTSILQHIQISNQNRLKT